MENLSTYFKIHLRDDNRGESEIRRFNVDKTSRVYHSFQAFCAQVQLLFPKLKDKPFIVYCKDNEDDITISSDPEYKIAMQLMTSAVKTFYVKLPSQEAKTQKSTKEHVVHIGITCDGCNAYDITGFRYKCIECEDYDLCSQCEAKGEHPHHHMIRMPQQFIGHRNKSFFHHLRKGLKKNNLHSNRKHGSCDYTFQGISPWIESSIPFLNDFITTLLFEKECHEGPNSSEVKLNRKVKHKFKIFFRVYQISRENISITIDTNNLNICQAHKNGKRDEPMDTEPMDTHVDEDASRKFPGEGRKLQDNAAGNIRSDTVTSSRRESLATSTSSQESSTAKVAPTDEWTILDKNDTAESVSANAPSAPKETSATQTIYPELPKETIIYHPDPMINEAVKTMMGMGFSNQGGLLTYVVAAEKGDINKILEILQPTYK
ncbi:refractory to sigma P [Xylocopa sonorina]|uniref:refractory to sigma P n=1 Tax=Xylocopa sonorina TaxID=1818115 RepID=UPI00403A96E1